MRRAVFVCIALTAEAQFFPSASPVAPQSEKAVAGGASFKVADWIDTGIELQPGDRVKLAGKGTIAYAGQAEVLPAGVQKGWMDLLKTFPVNDAGRGALVGRIGDSATVRAFVIGAEATIRAPRAGRLFLGLNQPPGETPTGAFDVTVEVERATPRPPLDESKLPRLTQEQIDSIPSRVVDAAGNEGDRVNFIVIGEEKRIVAALAAVGWVQVNRSKNEAVLAGIQAVLNRRSYIEIPMSELMMFDRVQDYGFAMGDPVKVVAERHHFRLWKAPFPAGGEEVWVGAGTHDIGFDKDQRDGKVTHKIDPNTDLEREFIVQTLRDSGEVATTYYLTRKDPVLEAKTAHGGEFHSDGRTLIAVFGPPVQPVQ